MLLNGLLIKNEDTGKFWAVEIPALDIHTQGRTKKEAYEMAADAVSVIIDDSSVDVSIVRKEGVFFKVECSDMRKVFPVLLRRLREKNGFSLADMQKKLGQKSKNGYARYEQGRAIPNPEQLSTVMELLGRPISL